MFKQYRKRMGRSLDVFAGIAAAGTLSACMSALLIFGATDRAASATTAQRTGVVSATGKGDKLCGRGDWAVYDANCGQQIAARSGRNVSVRVVSANMSVAERGMTANERIQAAFAALDARARTAALGNGI